MAQPRLKTIIDLRPSSFTLLGAYPHLSLVRFSLRQYFTISLFIKVCCSRHTFEQKDLLSSSSSCLATAQTTFFSRFFVQIFLFSSFLQFCENCNNGKRDVIYCVKTRPMRKILHKPFVAKLGYFRKILIQFLQYQSKYLATFGAYLQNS